jgi:hypothetical protein
MFGRCGNPHTARKIFEEIQNPDTFAYTSMISTLMQNKLPNDALAEFDSLLQSNNTQCISDSKLWGKLITGLVNNNLSTRALEYYQI